MQKALYTSGAFESHIAYELMCTDFLPLIDKHSVTIREDLQSLEKGLDTVITTQKQLCSDVFVVMQDVALLWDDHKIDMERAYREYEVRRDIYYIMMSAFFEYQEKLKEVRTRHNTDIQNMEANLDLVLDRLRQGGTHQVQSLLLVSYQ